jgi:hypothetical protein
MCGAVNEKAGIVVVVVIDSQGLVCSIPKKRLSQSKIAEYQYKTHLQTQEWDFSK